MLTPYLLSRSAFGRSIISEESRSPANARRGDAFISSCLRKIRPLVRRNLNTTRTRRGRVYYVPWHVRRFDIQESWQLPFRKIPDFFNATFRSGETNVTQVPSVSTRSSTRVVIFFWDHLWIILSKLHRQQLLRPSLASCRDFSWIFLSCRLPKRIGPDHRHRRYQRAFRTRRVPQ